MKSGVQFSRSFFYSVHFCGWRSSLFPFISHGCTIFACSFLFIFLFCPFLPPHPGGRGGYPLFPVPAILLRVQVCNLNLIFLYPSRSAKLRVQAISSCPFSRPFFYSVHFCGWRSSLFPFISYGCMIFACSFLFIFLFCPFLPPHPGGEGGSPLFSASHPAPCSLAGSGL
jgi:hypothetical protein